MKTTFVCRLISGLFLACAAPANAAVDHAIPWAVIGAKAGGDYKDDGLAVMPTADGARLRCAFQHLEGEAKGSAQANATTARLILLDALDTPVA